MKAFIVLAAIVASASAGVLLASPYGISPLGISQLGINQLGISPLARTIAVAAPQTVIAPAVTSSQYHAQDELGQYSYGYAGGPSAKSEIKTADGITRGGYSYIDANGVVQTVNYVSDALGFRVAATNLPVAPVAPVVAPVAALPGPIPQQVQDTPEVAAAKAKHLEAVAAAAAAAAAAPDN